MSEKEDKYMAKPIEATPILKGIDLKNFVQALKTSDSAASLEKRKNAFKLLKKATKSK